MTGYECMLIEQELELRIFIRELEHKKYREGKNIDLKELERVHMGIVVALL